MKTKFTVLGIGILLFVSCASTQKTSETKHELLTSKSLVGIWNQAFPDLKGKFHRSGNFKFINPDGTFYLMTVKFNCKKMLLNTPTGISVYGTYKVTSENTFTEHIKKHSLRPKMSNTKSKLRYELKNPDLLVIEYKNEAIGKWVPEVWVRVKPHKPLTDIKGLKVGV